MKKYLISLLVLAVAFASVAATTNSIVPFTGKKFTPCDVAVIPLHTRNTAESKDSIGASTGINVYGPYGMAIGDNGASASKMYIKGGMSTGTSSTIAVCYQICGGPSLADTGATWTSVDTITTTAGADVEVDLSGKAGQYICFRTHNYGSAGVLPYNLLVFLKAAVTIMHNR